MLDIENPAVGVPNQAPIDIQLAGFPHQPRQWFSNQIKKKKNLCDQWLAILDTLFLTPSPVTCSRLIGEGEGQE